MACTSTPDAGKVDRVLDAPHHHRLLVVRPAGRTPLRQTDTFPILGRIELVLGLASLNLAPGVNDKGGNLPARLREPFHPEDGGHRIRSRPLRHGLECPFLLRPIKGDYVEILVILSKPSSRVEAIRGDARPMIMMTS